MRSRCRQYVLPDAGSNEVTDSCVQTINCLFPPELMTIGELNVRVSSSAFHTSLPVSLWKATTQAPGLPPVNRISRSPSINGDGVPGENATL